MLVLKKSFDIDKRRDLIDLTFVIFSLLAGLTLVYYFKMGRSIPTQWDGVFWQISWEFVFAGLVPLALVTLRKGNWEEYGVTSKNALRSFSYGAVVLVAILALVYLMFGRISWTPSGVYESLLLDSPLKYPLALYAAISYFPLEMFFFSYLIVKFEKVVGSGTGVFTTGLVAASFYFGSLNHGLIAIITGASANVVLMKFLTVGFTFLILGLIFKKTRSLAGPLVVWTLINGLSF